MKLFPRKIVRVCLSLTSKTTLLTNIVSVGTANLDELLASIPNKKARLRTTSIPVTSYEHRKLKEEKPKPVTSASVAAAGAKRCILVGRTRSLQLAN